MNKTTRKFYIEQGEIQEKASKYNDALASYLEAFSINGCSEEDDAKFFEPGYVEDKIAYLAYRIGEYRIALTYGTKAARANPSEQRLQNNLPFYIDGLLVTNPKNKLDKYVIDYLKSNFSKDSTVLDIGPYDGKWSDKLRDYFQHMDAVEAFEPYIKQFELDKKYDTVFVEDARKFEFEHYDIIILGDVLEHMTIDDAQKLLKRLALKCKQLLVIIPYEYPQSEKDENEYQIHHQEDLTDKVFHERYPEFDLFACDELRGAYLKSGSFNGNPIKLEYSDKLPRTLKVGLVYFYNKKYDKALGVFNSSLEKMEPEFEAMMDYYSGDCLIRNNKTLEALRMFSKSVELLPSYKDAYLEIFKILEKLEFWEDLERYLKLALKHKDETNDIDSGNQTDWLSLLLIQLTLAISKQKRNFEAYGYAQLALDAPMSEERRKIAQYNFDEIKKELWGTLQL